ncbi:Hypothetical protein BSPT1_I0507 [Brucella suis bv. 2]|nr:Hypothetical protein BSPT1_I0507 [Brucella suis bv. 2]
MKKRGVLLRAFFMPRVWHAQVSGYVLYPLITAWKRCL